MVDKMVNERLRVLTAEDAGPYLVVPVEQLPQIQTLLDANAVRYWADEFAIALEGGKEVIFLNFSRQTDPAFVQQLLDSVL
jgi:hypothetical protein